MSNSRPTQPDIGNKILEFIRTNGLLLALIGLSFGLYIGTQLNPIQQDVAILKQRVKIQETTMLNMFKDVKGDITRIEETQKRILELLIEMQ